MNSIFSRPFRLLNLRSNSGYQIKFRPSSRYFARSSQTRLLESKKKLNYIQIRNFKDFDHGLEKPNTPDTIVVVVFLTCLLIIAIPWEPWVYAYTVKKEKEKLSKNAGLQNEVEEAASISNNQSEKSDESELESKQKKEKLGFRDRKVNTN